MIVRKLFVSRLLGETAIAEKFKRARSLVQNGQLDAGMSICQELLKAQPAHYDLNCLSGEISAKKGDASEALRVFARAIELKPELAIAYYKRANLLRDCGRLEESLHDYSQAIAANPNHAHAYCNRGVVLQHLHRFQDALDSYDQAIRLDPSDAISLFNRGAVLRLLNRPGDALNSYGRAIAVKSDYAECYCNLGLLLADLQRYPDALDCYDRCIAINPKFATAHFNRGVLLQAQKHWELALASYSRALEIEPDNAKVLGNRGMVLMELGNLDEAFSDFDRAVRLQPDFAEGYFNLGNLAARRGSHRAAVENYDKAIALKTNYADAFYNRADTLLQVRQYAAAVAGYDEAFREDPNRRYLRGMRLYSRLNLCDWAGLDAEIENLVAAMNADAAASPPFPLLALVDRPDLQLKCARAWVRNQSAITKSVAAIPLRQAGTRIRVGYFSGDFHTHPVSMLIAGVIENHDRSKFEAIAFSYGPDVEDEMRRRMKKAFDSFLDVRDMPDEDIARMSRALKIDIAVDLAGYTGNGRTKIFAWRAAPLQLNYLGYPGTMGADFIDYMIGDNTVIPIEQRGHYAEKILVLPTCFMPIDSARVISDKPLSREQFGLPAGGFVFCCFNNSYKLAPSIFDCWMRLLSRVPDSVLWLSKHSETAAKNIIQETKRRGVDSSRVIFAERMTSHAEHLARHRLADLFLDTYPYNAHATAADALWAGLPIVTLAGQGFAARVTAALLTSSGLQELISTSTLEYEMLAYELASNPAHLKNCKEVLARGRREMNVFNIQYFTRGLEAAYQAVLDRQHAGLSPDHLEVRLHA